jgi:Kef-type K+ transport system membrane component KefB
MEELLINFKKYVIVPQGAVVVLIPFIIWYVFRAGRIVPLAVVQIFSGILLGPSIFGAFAPDAYKVIFDKSLLGGVQGMALVAVSLFGFIAGTDADKEEIRHAGKSVIAIGVGSMLVTAAIGGLVGYYIAKSFPCSSPDQMACATGKSPNEYLFAAAFALATAIPALPILVILTRELELMRNRVGQIALAAAGVGDVISWASIALIIPFSKGGNVIEAVFIALSGAALNFIFLQYVASKYLRRLLEIQASERVLLSIVGIVVFISGTITALAGLHPVIGCFMAGIFLPDRIREFAAQRLDQPTQLILMPFFFLNTGLTAAFLYNDPVVWTIFAAGLAVCVFAKIGGTVVFARAMGEGMPTAVTVGSLLQTKGLMAIVVMTIFYKENVVSTTTFSAMVIMALVSTGLTMPLVRFLKAHYGEKLLPAAPPPKVVVSAA